MTIVRATALPLLAGLLLAACDKEPAPATASPDDVTEAATMADDAVGLAEQALDNAAMSDEPAASAPAPTRANSRPAETPPLVVDAEANGNETTTD